MPEQTRKYALKECICDADGIMHDQGCPCWREVSMYEVLTVLGLHLIRTGEGGVWHRAFWKRGDRSGCDCTASKDHPVEDIQLRFEVEYPR